jgi:hypothetical protein
MRIWLLARHQGKAPWTADAMERISGSLGVMAAEIESMKAEFARKDSAVDPGEIMRQVVDLERRFGAIHAQELARCADPRGAGALRRAGAAGRAPPGAHR